MVGWDRGATLGDRFRAHAGDRTHLYAVAMRAMADDWEAGGPVRDVCAGREDAPEGSALALRLLAGVFRVVLDGRAPELVPWYACLGGDRRPGTVWPVMRAVVAGHVEELRTGLELPPQTNEVGRAAALLVGLSDLALRSGTPRVRLLELGASAGLNLLVDRFRITGTGWGWGPAGSPVRLLDAVQGDFAPVPLVVTARAGCDLAPVDATTAEGRRLLTSFVWPFDLHRHARLSAALELVREHPVRVDRAMAGTWLPLQLAQAPAGAEDVLTVVWHSVTRLYWPAEEVGRVEDQLTSHGRGHRLGRVSMEFEDGDRDAPVLRTTLWDPECSEVVQHRRLGDVHDHGLPVRLTAPWPPPGAPGLSP